MLQVSELFIYPIKSLGGISLHSSVVTDRGFEYDRRWMLVNENNEFMTQRTNARMALLQVEVSDNALLVRHKEHHYSIRIPFEPEMKETVMVDVWSDRCRAQLVSEQTNEWFSDILSTSCRLVYMPEGTRRRVDGRYAQNKEITAFSDGYPFMIIGQSSLDELNGRLNEKVPMNRFRPNIVFTGGLPFEEDGWTHFSINDIEFYGVKLCARCIVTTIDQDRALKGKEPLKTLSTYRMRNNKIYFGQNLLHHGAGSIRIGDAISIKERKPAPLFKINT